MLSGADGNAGLRWTPSWQSSCDCAKATGMHYGSITWSSEMSEMCSLEVILAHIAHDQAYCFRSSIAVSCPFLKFITSRQAASIAGGLWLLLPHVMAFCLMSGIQRLALMLVLVRLSPIPARVLLDPLSLRRSHALGVVLFIPPGSMCHERCRAQWSVYVLPSSVSRSCPCQQIC